uniref:Cell division cycle associated 4 n=1 Tax=Iconisemion striatum TaxID=60296 RepID=A0A1A7XTW0_9TELE
MFPKGTKRKFSDPGEEPVSSGDQGPAAPSAAARTLTSSYSLQRQSLLDMSLIKLQLCHMLVEPNLCRSVLIANTVRQIQEEMTQDGTWHIMTQALAAAQCPADRLVATEVLCRQTDAAAQAGQSPKPFSVVGLQEGYHSEEVVMEGDVETEVTMSSLSPLSPQLSSASYLTGPFEMGPCWEEEEEEEDEEGEQIEEEEKEQEEDEDVGEKEETEEEEDQGEEEEEKEEEKQEGEAAEANGEDDAVQAEDGSKEDEEEHEGDSQPQKEEEQTGDNDEEDGVKEEGEAAKEEEEKTKEKPGKTADKKV